MKTKETSIAKSAHPCSMDTLLAIAFTLKLLVVPDVAQSQFDYVTNNGTITITRYTGSGGAVTIPGTINSLPVTTIGGYAFYSANVASVKFPDSVTSIGGHAFDICKLLTSVMLPDGLLTIGDYAFESCIRLTDVVIPDSVLSIGEYAFCFCGGLTSVRIGNSVTSIEDHTFDSSGLKDITIGRGLSSIGNRAFGGCSRLTAVFLEGNAPNIGSLSGLHSPTTVYYLPGTMGWGSTLGDVPTALWLPQIETSGPNFGVGPNGFGFTISWASDMTFVVEASTDMTRSAWAPLATNTLTSGTAYFSDPHWTNFPARFYRVRWP